MMSWNPLDNLGSHGKQRRNDVEQRCAEWVANAGYIIDDDGNRVHVPSQRKLANLLHASRKATDKYCAQYRKTFELLEAAKKLIPTAPVETAAPATAAAPTIVEPPAGDVSFEIELPPPRKPNQPDAVSLAAAWELQQHRAGRPTYGGSARGRRPSTAQF
jgi:hypothetical protein